MGLYSFRQMFQIEEKIFSDSGLSPEILMEHAGFSMARRIEELCRERSLSSAAVLCGCGHNGGDGFVSGLLYGVLRGWEPEKCLQFGWASGALVVTLLTDYATPADEEQIWSIYAGNARVKR